MAEAGDKSTAPARGGFVVELGDDNNRMISIMTLKLRLRGTYDPANHRRRQVGAMAQMPVIPGIHIAVDYAKKTAAIADPLSDPKNRDILREIGQVAEAANMAGAVKFGPAKKACTVHQLDAHQFKTLVRELAYKVGKKSPPDAVLRKGRLPEDDEIAAMDGRFLNDPWNTSNEKPKYEDQVAEFVARLQNAGVA